MSLNRHKKEGFTLIEIAAALMVFAVLSITILVAQGHMTRRARAFVDAYQDLVEAKNARLKLERDGKLGQKERIDIPGMVPLSYEFRNITQKSSLHSFSKACGFGLMDAKMFNGSIDRFFSIVPLPIETKTAVLSVSTEQKKVEQEKQGAKKNA